jgi:predicted nucleic acid-binding protein
MQSGRSAVQVLVDSSVWIDYFTGAATSEAELLDSLLGRSPLVVADIVLTEVLHGLPDELHRKQAREALGKFWRVDLAGFDLAGKSAVNFHTLRARGIPVRTAECRIATFCLDQGYALLHSSPGYYEPFEKHLGLQVAG